MGWRGERREKGEKEPLRCRAAGPRGLQPGNSRAFTVCFYLHVLDGDLLAEEVLEDERHTAHHLRDEHLVGAALKNWTNRKAKRSDTAEGE